MRNATNLLKMFIYLYIPFQDKTWCLNGLGKVTPGSLILEPRNLIKSFS